MAILAALALGLVTSRGITGPLGKAVTMIQALGSGHLGMQLKSKRRGEIGILAKTMDLFADDLQNVVVGTMKKISNGDLSTDVSLKDSHDEISPALLGTTAPLRGLVAETKSLSPQRDA